MTPPKLSAAFDLTGQTALITGGGTGLGLGMAHCLAAAGARVVLVGRREAELVAACAAIGPLAQALPGDITQLDTIPALVEQAEKQAGPIGILLNNAGVHLKKPALETTDADFALVLQTHVNGAFALTREVGQRMVTRRTGSVIFTASMASLMGIPLVVAYAAANHRADNATNAPTMRDADALMHPIEAGQPAQYRHIVSGGA